MTLIIFTFCSTIFNPFIGKNFYHMIETTHKMYKVFVCMKKLIMFTRMTKNVLNTF